MRPAFLFLKTQGLMVCLRLVRTLTSPASAAAVASTQKADARMGIIVSSATTITTKGHGMAKKSGIAASWTGPVKMA
jgi:hypothetical protein